MNLTARAFPFGLGKLESRRFGKALGFALLGFACPILSAATLTPLYSFTNGVDGSFPSAGLVLGQDGNFYGTADNGGTNGDGAIFKISAGGVLTTLYSFTNGVDGALVAGPRPRLCQGRDGNFYGTTCYGGTDVQGNIYKITSNGAFTVVYSFTNGGDGACPSAGLIQSSDGNFYGTTAGTDGHGAHPCWGGVFKLAGNGKLTTLYSFTNGTDGAAPSAPLLQGEDGNFYGTTGNGGKKGDGTVFKISVQGAFTSLYSFTNGVDGALPTASLVQAGDGSFLGTTYGGGARNWGSIFKITSAGQLTPIYSFTNGLDCAGPFAGLMQGHDGDYYGITRYGGAKQAGGIFQITASGKLTPIYTFTNGVDGERPYGGLVQGADESLYGATEFGGAGGWGAGIVFRLDLKDRPVPEAPPAAAAAPELAATTPDPPLQTNNTGANAPSAIAQAAPSSNSLPPLEPAPAAPPEPLATETANHFSPVQSSAMEKSAAPAPAVPAALAVESEPPPVPAKTNIDNTNVALVASAPPPPGPALAPAAAPSASAETAVKSNTPPPAPAALPRAALPSQVARVSGTEGTGLRLRASASLSSWVLTIMPDGSQVTLLGETKTSGGFRWQNVQYGKLTGWAASDYLVFGVAAK